jgi:hypothetical protein
MKPRESNAKPYAFHPVNCLLAAILQIKRPSLFPCNPYILSKTIQNMIKKYEKRIRKGRKTCIKRIQNRIQI